DAKQPQIIETAWRRGYRFIAKDGAGDIAPVPVVNAQAPLVSAPAAGTPAVPPITGRVAALSRLQAAWGRASAGQRQLCWLAGEARRAGCGWPPSAWRR